VSLRGRLVGALSAVTMVTLGAAFTAISFVVDASQLRQLDDALRVEAVEEARESASLGGDRLAISDRPGPFGNDLGPLTKYGAIYNPDGTALAMTPTFRGTAPLLTWLHPRDGEAFDMWFGGEHLRGMTSPVPGRSGHRLLLAAPRTDLDGDATFLLRSMLVVFAVAFGLVVLIATWIVRRLTREHQAITAVAHRVAAGDLTARVGTRRGDPELAQLARDIDEMIDRLALLVTSQQQFIAHAAHELRSPLTTLYGELSHALRKSRDAESYRQAVEEALDSTRRLKLIAEDLLALARVGADTGEPGESVRAHSLVRRAIEAISWETAERGVRIDVSGPDATLSVRPRDVERLFRNVIENAVRHSPRGDVVDVIAVLRDGEFELTVRDAGPGVSAVDRARVFEPFYRGSRERASELIGAGLGLAIARAIARAHSGDLLLADLPDTPNGACFLIRLPLSSAPPEP
jgi:two-component system, OmpR family, sensor kinase